VIAWGDGSINTTLNLVAGVTTFSAAHTYADDGSSPGNGTASDTHTITTTVSDDDTGTAGGSTTIVVNNVAPVLSVPATPPASDGTPFTFTGTVTDPGAQDAHTVAISWGHGSAGTT